MTHLLEKSPLKFSPVTVAEGYAIIDHMCAMWGFPRFDFVLDDTGYGIYGGYMAQFFIENENDPTKPGKYPNGTRVISFSPGQIGEQRICHEYTHLLTHVLSGGNPCPMLDEWIAFRQVTNPELTNTGQGAPYIAQAYEDLGGVGGLIFAPSAFVESNGIVVDGALSTWSQTKSFQRIAQESDVEPTRNWILERWAQLFKTYGPFSATTDANGRCDLQSSTAIRLPLSLNLVGGKPCFTVLKRVGLAGTESVLPTVDGAVGEDLNGFYLTAHVRNDPVHGGTIYLQAGIWQ